MINPNLRYSWATRRLRPLTVLPLTRGCVTPATHGFSAPRKPALPSKVKQANIWVLWVRAHTRRGQLGLFLKHQKYAQTFVYVVTAEDTHTSKAWSGSLNLFVYFSASFDINFMQTGPLLSDINKPILKDIIFSVAPQLTVAAPAGEPVRHFFRGFDNTAGIPVDDACRALMSTPMLTRVVYRTLGRRLRKILKNTRRFKKIVRYLPPQRRLFYVCRLARFLLRASNYATLGERITKLVEIRVLNDAVTESQLTGVCRRQQVGNISELFSRRSR